MNQPPQKPAPIIDIRSRASAAPTALPSLAAVPIAKMDLDLDDIGFARVVTDEGERVVVTGPGCLLSDVNTRLLPIYDAVTARLIAELLLQAARAVDCPDCSKVAPAGVAARPPTSCPTCCP